MTISKAGKYSGPKKYRDFGAVWWMRKPSRSHRQTRTRLGRILRWLLTGTDINVKVKPSQIIIRSPRTINQDQKGVKVDHTAVTQAECVFVSLSIFNINCSIVDEFTL